MEAVSKLLKLNVSKQNAEAIMKALPYLAVIFLMVLFTVKILVNIDYYSRNIPLPWHGRDYLTAWCFSVVLGGIIFILPVRYKRLLLLYWFVRVLVCLVLMLFYESFYGMLDAYNYIFWDTSSLIDTEGVAQGTFFTGVIAASLMKLTGDSYHSVKLFFSFFGMWGIYFLCRMSELYFGKRDLCFFALCALYPSTIFWTSILGKDPIQVLAIGMFFLGMMKIIKRGTSLKSYILVVAGAMLAFIVRPWYLAFMLLVIPVGLWKRTGILTKLVVMASIPMIVVYSGYFGGSSSFTEQMSSYHENFAESGGGSTLAAKDISSPSKFVMTLPYLIFTTIYRPLPFDVNNAFSLLACIENMFLLVMTFMALKKIRWSHFKSASFLTLMTYITVWSVAYAGPGSANLGTAVRYKISMLPVLLIVMYGLIKRYGISDRKKYVVDDMPEGKQINEGAPK